MKNETEVKGPSKIESARAVFISNFGVKTPKEIKTIFIEEVGLTKSGASTYYYKFKAETNAQTESTIGE